MIKKEKSLYKVESESGKNLGKYKTEKELPIEHYEAMVDNVIKAGLLS